MEHMSLILRASINTVTFRIALKCSTGSSHT